MKLSIVQFAILFAALSLGLFVASAQNLPQSLPKTSETSRITAQVPAPLKITYGNKSATFTPAQLAAMPQTTVTVSNDHTKSNDTYAGVPVIDLLTQLGISPKPHGQELRLYLVFVGSDDYEVTFGMGEIAPYIHDSPTIVAVTENGKPLTSDGPLKLISSGDKMPERWVRHLVAIHVLAASN
jgi:hypothetical protein